MWVPQLNKNSDAFYGQALKESQLELWLVICFLFFILKIELCLQL